MNISIAHTDRPAGAADSALQPLAPLASLEPLAVAAEAPIAPFAVSLSLGPRPLQGLLTQRQLEVLKLLSGGLSNKQIARALGIREGTVKIHLAAIFRALRAPNRTAAVVAAQALAAADDFRSNQTPAHVE